MRYKAAEKLEIIRLVEGSVLPVKQILGEDRPTPLDLSSMVRALPDGRPGDAG
ncbi:hypothetical protein ASILVAE211_24255 [Acidisoma silvae]|uniref:Uncharacterized protein n=1 Tax=Acidisoma silvae TaxID=2802396 RepID=A0A964E1J4_9PROT|nr:hypothetical protein [Acidisoma silvae]